MALALSTTRRSVKQSLADLLEQKHNDICDVTFEIQTSADKSEEIRGIRSLLALHSPVFKSMLFGKMKEAELGSHVIINDISPDTFRLLMSVCYGLKVELTKENVVSVLYAAKKYMIGALEKACVDFIGKKLSENVDELVPVLTLLYRYGLSETLDSVLVECRPNARNLMESKAFLNLHQSIVAKIIQDDLLKIKEELIWSRCVEWAQYQSQAKKKAKVIEDEKNDPDTPKFSKDDYRYYLRPLIRFIRFPVMPKKFFEKEVKKSGVLSKKEISDYKTCFINQERGFLFKFDIYNDAHANVTDGKILKIKSSHSGYVLFSTSRGFQERTQVHEFTLKIIKADQSLGVGVAPKNDTPPDTWLAKVEGVHFYSFTGGLMGEGGTNSVSCEKYGNGDMITIKLDFTALKMQCLKNGNFVGEHDLNPDTTYYPIVGCSGNSTHVEL